MMMKKTIRLKQLFLAIFILTFSANGFSQQVDWVTFCEHSSFMETPRYNETIRYCKQLADHSPSIRFASFGISPQGRELPLLIVNKNGMFTAEEVRASDHPVVMIQAGIHPGESEGKDAGLMLLRDLIIHDKYPGLLENTTVLFIPIFNVDGHERWSKYSRINQNGPIEMGWRVNAQNLNLNRDYMKATSPEMKAWLELYHKWMPEFFIDCHTTDGADYQYVLTYAMEIYGNMDKGLTRWQKDKFIPDMEKHMFANEMPVFPYVSFRTWHDPRSGLKSGVSTPMISNGYTALLNRPGLLIETHMLKPYKPRVESTYELLKFSINYVNSNQKELKSLIAKADEKARQLAYTKDQLAVDYKISMQDSVMVDFLGIDYEVVKSDLTGYNWYKYGDEAKTFSLPFFNTSVPTEKVQLPMSYIIPEEWNEVIAIIKNHGIAYEELGDSARIVVDSYEFVDYEMGRSSYEGEQRVSIQEMKPITEERFYSKGSIVIHTYAQANSRTRLLAYLLEPMADNSLVSWGYFNSIFEQKEYAETYVMEKMAREMIRKNPELLKEFEEMKVKDPNFTKSHWTMTNWFYKRTAYWDSHLNKYPVGKLTSIE